MDSFSLQRQITNSDYEYGADSEIRFQKNVEKLSEEKCALSKAV